MTNQFAQGRAHMLVLHRECHQVTQAFWRGDLLSLVNFLRHSNNIQSHAYTTSKHGAKVAILNRAIDMDVYVSFVQGACE